MNGRKTTSYAAVRDDLVNAGAVWSDEAVVVDKNLVSSRTPDDLPVFMQAVLAVLAGEER
jgi:protease I